jgi:predicted alpha-1,6-mannanase (GH76 family)
MLWLPLTRGETAEAEPELTKEAVTAKVVSGIGLLNKLYWSPTLNIWLDRTGDDLRGHYEGRVNPPWWSSANAVEVLLDFMKATGTSEYERSIENLYELHKDRRRERPLVVAELKRRGQWNAGDEQEFQRRQKKAETSPPDSNWIEHHTEFRNEYLDDSAWWGVAWLKMYDRTHTEKYLATAKAIHAHMARNWRPDKDGGVMWCEEKDKVKPNAITNSLFLILSARLYQRTQDAQYLAWAQKTLDWLHAKALYDGTGVVDAPGHQGDYWTYNQGAYIGGLVALYQATGKQVYLDEALKVADSVLNRAGLTLPGGIIVEKLGTGGWDPGLFKGVLVRYLGQLRDVLNAKKLHPEAARQIDQCIRASMASMLRNSVAADGQFAIEWHPGAKDQTRNFNTQTSALASLVAVLPDMQP